MTFMKKDVNLGLMVLIVASIILFSGFSVYYQTTFKDVSIEYRTKLDQLSQVTNELSSKRQELNETYSLRVKAEEDRKVLDERYKDASNENYNLRADNTNLRSEVSSTKSQLAEKSAKLAATENLLAQTQSSLSSANSKISSLNSKLDDVCDDYTPLNGGVEHDRC